MFRIRLNSTALQAELRRARTTGVSRATSQLATETARWTLGQTIQLQPVDTGRSREAWIDELARLNAAAADNSGSGTTGGDRHEVQYANGVPYVIYVEYGTSQMAARAMARRPLGSAGPLIHSLLSAYLQRIVAGQ